MSRMILKSRDQLHEHQRGKISVFISVFENINDGWHHGNLANKFRSGTDVSGELFPTASLSLL